MTKYLTLEDVLELVADLGADRYATSTCWMRRSPAEGRRLGRDAYPEVDATRLLESLVNRKCHAIGMSRSIRRAAMKSPNASPETANW